MISRTNTLVTPQNVYLMAGDVHVSHEPHIVTTVLGSCISVCLYDPVLKVGAMNHFKSAICDEHRDPTAIHGDIAMEKLINGMLNMGCKISSFGALVFGGAELLPATSGQSSIGKCNTTVALNTLNWLNIPIIMTDIGGTSGRKIIFDTLDGSFDVMKINPDGYYDSHKSTVFKSLN